MRRTLGALMVAQSAADPAGAAFDAAGKPGAIRTFTLRCIWMLASISLFLCDSLNEPNVMTERARALIGRMVVFGDTIGRMPGGSGNSNQQTHAPELRSGWAKEAVEVPSPTRYSYPV